MAKTKETPVTEAPRAMNLSVKDARKRQRMVDDGGTPTLRGTIAKIILLGIADAIALFVAMILITGNRIDYAAAVVIVTLIFNLIYQNNLPDAIKCYFSDVYLFCLHKDPADLTKL